MGVCLSDPPSENLIKGAARENSAAWRCRLFAQIFILPIFLSTMTSRVADISKVGRGKEIAWEDVLEIDRMARRFLLGKQRDEYLLKNHSGACKPINEFLYLSKQELYFARKRYEYFEIKEENKLDLRKSS